MRLAFLLLVLVVLHLVANVALPLGALAPDLFAVTVLTASQRLGGAWGATLGLFLGLAEDSMSLTSFGASAFALAMVGGAAGRLARVLKGDSSAFRFALFAVGKWSRDLLAWLVSDAATRPPAVDALLVEAPLAALYAATVGIAVGAFLSPGPRTI